MQSISQKCFLLVYTTDVYTHGGVLQSSQPSCAHWEWGQFKYSLKLTSSQPFFERCYVILFVTPKHIYLKTNRFTYYSQYQLNTIHFTLPKDVQSLFTWKAPDQIVKGHWMNIFNFPGSCKHLSVHNQQLRQQNMRNKVRWAHLLSSELSPRLLIGTGALITEACIKRCREIVGKGFPAEPCATTKH